MTEPVVALVLDRPKSMKCANCQRRASSEFWAFETEGCPSIIALDRSGREMFLDKTAMLVSKKYRLLLVRKEKAYAW